MASVSVHWDVENCCVPRGASVIQVCGRIRDCVIGNMGCINAFYVYLDVGKAPAKLRHELAMAGADLIDCSTTQGKPGQVDLRIIARVLRTSPHEGVVIVSGDSDMAYTISQLRSAGRQTALMYDSNNTGSVSTQLLEVPNVTLPVAFDGNEPVPATATEAGEATVPATATAGSSRANVALTTTQRHFLDAIERSPEADAGGWKSGPCIGELFARLYRRDNAAFRTAKKALVEAKLVEKHASGRDVLRVKIQD